MYNNYDVRKQSLITSGWECWFLWREDERVLNFLTGLMGWDFDFSLMKYPNVYILIFAKKRGLKNNHVARGSVHAFSCKCVVNFVVHV